jgi:hypothetical protein
LFPHDFVSAIAGRALAWKEQYEFVDKVYPVKLKPNTLFGNIGNKAVPWSDADSKFDRGQPSHAVARALASLVNIHRTHSSLPNCAKPSGLASTSVEKNIGLLIIECGLIRELKFSSDFWKTGGQAAVLGYGITPLADRCSERAGVTCRCFVR